MFSTHLYFYFLFFIFFIYHERDEIFSTCSIEKSTMYCEVYKIMYVLLVVDKQHIVANIISSA
jgi:hypothetical protein